MNIVGRELEDKLGYSETPWIESHAKTAVTQELLSKRIQSSQAWFKAGISIAVVAGLAGALLIERSDTGETIRHWAHPQRADRADAPSEE